MPSNANAQEFRLLASFCCKIILARLLPTLLRLHCGSYAGKCLRILRTDQIFFCDFHIFGAVKKDSWGRQFAFHEDMRLGKIMVPQAFFLEGIDQLVSKWHKCLRSYAEIIFVIIKQLTYFFSLFGSLSFDSPLYNTHQMIS